MLYPLCPTCGALMANIQIPYLKDMAKLYEEEGIDHELASRIVMYDERINAKKKAILDKYTDPERICCRMRLANFIEIVKLIN